MPTSFTQHLLSCATGLALLLPGSSGVPAQAAETAAPHRRAPRLFPDYTEIVIPPNIAPLNFRVEEPGTGYRVEIRSHQGKPIVLTGRGPSLGIPRPAWQQLLQANAGQPLYLDVSVQDGQSGWSRFATVTNFIAREPIDSHLAYRLIKPLYNIYVNVGIYQRDLESFEQHAVLENSHTDGSCLNCHTFLNRRPDTFALHIRTSTNLHPMLLVRSNEVARVDKTMGYLAWHPSGRLLAFSANKLSLMRHTLGETRDVFDARSDLGIYRVDSNVVVTPPAIALPDRNETWPAWSPDGHYLYYCSAPMLPAEQFRKVRYDLMRIRYDIDRDQWSEPEVLVSAQETGLSAGQPKPSPDGRFLLFCLCKYGNFPIYQPSSDLYVIDLQTRRCRRLENNSEQADSWHCWSSNSRWIVFSSKRLDGLFARPFFSYVDEQGQFHKPFLLPQAAPEFYDSYLNTFNVPELIQGPVTIKESDLARATLKPVKRLIPSSNTQPAASNSAGGREESGESGYQQAHE